MLKVENKKMMRMSEELQPHQSYHEGNIRKMQSILKMAMSNLQLKDACLPDFEKREVSQLEAENIAKQIQEAIAINKAH